MCGIYKITNLVNRKSYIGQSIDIEKRWEDHKRVAFRKSDKSYDYPLYRAIRKYGLESFKFEVIEECEEDKLDEVEIFYIEKFQSHIHQNGYNLTLGGDGGRLGIHLFQYDFDGKFIREYGSYGDAERKTGIDTASIERAVKGKKQSAGNFIWTIDKDEDITEKIKKLSKANYSNGTKEDWVIDVYDLYGNFIKTFSNAQKAGNELGIPAGNITRCIKRGKYVTRGLQFVKHGNHPVIFNGAYNCKRAICQYSLDGCFIARYDSASEAGKILGIDPSSIAKCCKNKLKYYKDSIWKYENE